MQYCWITSKVLVSCDGLTGARHPFALMGTSATARTRPSVRRNFTGVNLVSKVATHHPLCPNRRPSEPAFRKSKRPARPCAMMLAPAFAVPTPGTIPRIPAHLPYTLGASHGPMDAGVSRRATRLGRSPSAFTRRSRRYARRWIVSFQQRCVTNKARRQRISAVDRGTGECPWRHCDPPWPVQPESA